ncbi:MAG: AraC family transcriptional regulator [Lachnospiraceae bacterium]|nr:AraC family transcriptional regulator [Lachnospiraceae bacterium]MDE7238201.1 AraC family transcriptional regulator [Lachnospiraceae bacterium]
MRTKPTALPADDYLKEKKTHGNLEYPIAIYHVDLRSLYMGFVRWHWHEELEIDIVTQGKMECLIGDETILLETGDAIYINQNTMHSLHPVGEEPGKFDAIVFHPMLFFGYSKTYLNAKYLTPITGKTEFRYFLINKEYARSADMIALFDELVRANDSAATGYELITKSCLCRFWVYMLEEFSALVPEKKETRSLSELRARDAVLFIERHYQEPITLDEIAAAIHVSKSECCRCFKKALHATPFEYLMRYRIFMASVIIRQDAQKQMSFSELATTVGFNTVSYFNKVFKSILGCTPTEYRKTLRDGSARDVSVFPSVLYEEHISMSDSIPQDMV